MALIYITGPTAAGKSTVGEALRAKGYEVHDADSEAMRFRVDRSILEPFESIINSQLDDSQQHENYTYALAEEPVRALYKKAKDRTIFLVGVRPNDLDYKKWFSKLILLSVDENTQADRIKIRTNNQYGKKPYQFVAAQKWRPVQIDKYRSAGAIEIDATQPLEKVVGQILSYL